MGQVRYMSRAQFKKVAAEGDSMGFNRQVAPWVLKKLPKHGQFGVMPLLVHEHIGGQVAEPHMRTLVGFTLKNGKIGAAYIDMAMDTFNSLPPLPADGSGRVAPTMPRFADTVA